MTRITTTLMTITPEKAEKWLAKNENNRRLNKHRVSYLASAMRRGEWQVNGDAIRFAHNGNLIDGQTRLAAIVVSKKSIDSLVIRGLEETARTTIDIGKPRTNADHLSMAGYTGGVTALAAAVGACLSWDDEGKFIDKRAKASPDEMLNFLDDNKRMLKSLEVFSSKTDLARLLPLSLSIALHYMFCNIDRDKGESFFHHLSEGANLGKKSPILKLRTELIAMRQDSKHKYLTRHAFLHFATHAFDAYLDDKQIDSLPEYRRLGTVSLPKKRK